MVTPASSTSSSARGDPTDSGGGGSGLRTNWIDESAAACGEMVFTLLEALGAREDVDAERVGCGGLSGGGLRTVYLGLEGRPVHTGEFGADMKIALVNDGPVTLILEK